MSKCFVALGPPEVGLHSSMNGSTVPLELRESGIKITVYRRLRLKSTKRSCLMIISHYVDQGWKSLIAVQVHIYSIQPCSIIRCWDLFHLSDFHALSTRFLYPSRFCSLCRLANVHVLVPIWMETIVPCEWWYDRICSVMIISCLWSIFVTLSAAVPLHCFPHKSLQVNNSDRSAWRSYGVRYDRPSKRLTTTKSEQQG